METPSHFTIVASHYTPSSNGVVLLYKLAAILESLGHRVTLVPKDQSLFLRYPKAYSDTLRAKFTVDPAQTSADSIAIIPETTSQDIIDALPAKHRVFYLLNRPYVLTGKPLHYRPDDMVVAYSGLISKAHLNLFITNPIADFERIEQQCVHQPEKEHLVLVYFGKSRQAGIPSELTRTVRKNRARIVVINRTYPKSRDILFDLLRRARLLVSFDPLTNLSYEATLCGTPSFIADNYMKLQYSDFNDPLWGFFENPAEIESRYAQGISPATHANILRMYHENIANSESRVRLFVNACRDWFSFTEKAAGDPALSEFLLSHNRLRMELDHAAFLASGGRFVDHAFAGYDSTAIAATPMQRILRQLIHRRERLVWNMKRNWHKHVSGLKGEALAEKLKTMQDAHELRKLGSQNLRTNLR
jgi:hypothetical protein